MMSIVWAVLIALGFLISVMLVRTLSFASKQITFKMTENVEIKSNDTSHRLAGAIQIQTISYSDASKTKTEEFAKFHSYLEQNYPLVHANLEKEVVGDYSLLYRWKGADPTLKPILLLAHIDVVPVNPESKADWHYPPFSGRIADSFIWGRGSMDDKSNVLGVLEAVEMLIGEKFNPQRTLYIAFGHDEELTGKQGASKIAALLKSRGISFESVLDEGMVVTEGILPNISSPVALIGVAEKGYASVELSVETEGGHSSMPPDKTAIGLLSAAINKLENHPFSARIKGPIRQMFNYVGPEMSWFNKMVFANLWLFGPLVEGQLAKSPSTNAVIRTTTAPTVFESGVKENVLPAHAKAIVNFRILPGDSIETVLDHVRKTIDDPKITIKLLEATAREPSKESSIKSPGFKKLQKTIAQVFPDAIIAPSLVVSATDSRFYESLSLDIYRFQPLRLNSEDTHRIHGVDERLSVQNYIECIKFYLQYIRNTTT